MEYISIYISNLGRFNESWGGHCGEWVKLPVPKEKLDAVLKRIGIGRRYEEYFVPCFETSGTFYAHFVGVCDPAQKPFFRHLL